MRKIYIYFAVQQKLTEHFKSVIINFFKKNELLPLATTWMDLEVITLSKKISQ